MQGARRRTTAWTGIAAWVVALACCTPAPAFGAGPAADDHSFPPPSSDNYAGDTAVAPNGYAVAAWQEVLIGGQYRIDVAVRPPGGPWGEPQPLGTTTLFLGIPQVAVNDSGAAAVTWTFNDNMGNFGSEISTRAPGGTFGGPESFPLASGDVGVDNAGDVTFLYGLVNQPNTADNGLYQRIAPAGSSFTGATAVPLSHDCLFGVTLEENAAGDAVASFSTCNGVGFGVRRAGSWEITQPFTNSGGGCPSGSGTTFSGAHIAISPDGHPVGVVGRSDYTNDCISPPPGFGTNKTSIVMAVDGPAGMTAGATIAESETGSQYTVPHDVSPQAIDIAGGSALVVYREAGQNGFDYTGTAKTLPVNGTDASVAAIPVQNTDGYGFAGGLGLTDNGQAVLIWAKQFSANKFQAVASFRPTGGAFRPPVAISPDGQEIQSVNAGATPSGDALVLYSLGNGSPPRTIHARAFDATPPVLSGVSIPSSAAFGAAVSFAAQATDTWDPFTIGWNFGDGTGDGTSPSHAFGAPGPQNVAVTATDSAGNAASQSGTVTVNAPPLVVNPGPPTATVPVLSELKLTNVLFRVGKNPTATTASTKRKKKIPIGTTFTYKLSDAATVTIAIARKMPGRKSGKRCVAPTKKRVKAKAKKCTRYVPKGKLTRNGVAGANRIPFSGRVGKRALAPGSYRARLTPKRGNLAGAPKAVRFKTVR